MEEILWKLLEFFMQLLQKTTVGVVDELEFFLISATWNLEGFNLLPVPIQDIIGVLDLVANSIKSNLAVTKSIASTI